MSAIATDTTLAEIWLGSDLVNGGSLSPAPRGPARPRSLQLPQLEQFPLPRIHDFDRLFALPRRRDWASVRPPDASPKDNKDFP